MMGPFDIRLLEHTGREFARPVRRKTIHAAKAGGMVRKLLNNVRRSLFTPSKRKGAPEGTPHSTLLRGRAQQL